MALALLKRKRDITGFLEHFLMTADKADKDVFTPDALIAYDESVKDMSKKSGIEAFAKVELSLIVKHLSYDGTRNASIAKEAKTKKFSTSAALRKTAGYCIKFNCDPTGCNRVRITCISMFVQPAIQLDTLWIIAPTLSRRN